MDVSAIKDIVCPTILALLAFIFNLSINKKVDGMAVMYSLLSLPKELMLLSMGFSTLIIFNDAEVGIIILLLNITFSALVYLLYQNSKNYLETSSGLTNVGVIKKWWKLFLSLSSSFVISVIFYIWTLYVCLGGQKI